jgi:hypothetical protein
MLVLGALWFGHRNAFEYIRRTDHPHTWLTLAMLAFVAVVPWTTALVAQHRHSPQLQPPFGVRPAVAPLRPGQPSRNRATSASACSTVSRPWTLSSGTTRLPPARKMTLSVKQARRSGCRSAITAWSLSAA